MDSINRNPKVYILEHHYGNNCYDLPEDSWRRRLDFLDYLSPYGQPAY